MLPAQIMEGSLSNVIIQNSVGPPPVACANYNDLASRLNNALERAIRAHRETTGRTRNATFSGSAAVPGCEVGGEMDVNIKDETWDMNIQIVEVGIFKDGTVVGLGSSMEENAKKEVLLFTQPSASSEVGEPHCILRECPETIIQSPRSNYFLSTERLPGNEVQAGTAYTPHPVLIKQEEEIDSLKCISLSQLEKGQVKDLEADLIVAKLGTIPVAVSTPGDVVKQSKPVEQPEDPTGKNIPDTVFKEEPGKTEPLSLQEKLLRQATQPTLQAQPVTQEHNVKMRLQSSTPVLTQNYDVNKQAIIFQNPEPEGKQQRGGTVLRGQTGYKVYPTKDLLCHEMEKYLRPCSVRLEDVQRRLKLARLGNRNLRICFCTDCGKAFARKRHLRWHQRLSHTGEKPYSCSQCTRIFSLRKNLAKHKRFHTGEKPYSCNHCEKSFRCNAKLKTHMRFHTGEKPFGCGLCGKKYRVLKNFKSHVTTTHPHANPPPGQFLIL
ncbi:hypothetical protein UPYG_G00236490 [Umbra pygmaea]|uniref:C2H2-type domain-containing protein n=1 Tax=Umbra pygmaea TaxID=75934 RepID=A0ABD0WJG4_UMBPY